MENEMYDRQTVETLRQKQPLKVKIAAETWKAVFRTGDEIRLAQKNGRFCLQDEKGRTIPAEICVNVPLEEALSLSLADTAFVIKKHSDNVLKAEMKIPGSVVREGQTEQWFSLS